MNSHDTHRRPLRTADPASLEPGVSAGSERFRAVTLNADAPDTGSVARRAAFEALNDWGLRGLVDDATLCVSELVGNAVHHATPDGWKGATGRSRRIAVTFRAWPTCFFVEVSDEDSTPPMLPAGDLLSEHDSDKSADLLLADSGRGLLIVQSLCDAAWWAPRDDGGKSVFCRFDFDDDGPLPGGSSAPQMGVGRPAPYDGRVSAVAVTG